MLIDTHAHINFNAFRDDADAVIRRSLENNVWLINVGSQYSTSKRAMEMAEKYSKGVYAAVGLHPVHLETGLVKIKTDPEEIQFNTTEEIFNCQKYKELARSEKVTAIGEIGLDYYYKPKTKAKTEQFKEKQKEVFLSQLALAKEMNLPVILHCRSAHEDLIEILKSEIRSTQQIQNSKLRGVVHCFTGNWEQAEKYLEMGFYLGFNGIIFKLDLDEVTEKVPLNRILLETDCPYLTPPQAEGRNEPIYIKHIAGHIAKIKSLSYEEISKVATQNAEKLFKIS